MLLYLYICHALCSFLYCVHVIFVILRLIKELGHIKQGTPIWEGLGAPYMVSGAGCLRVTPRRAVAQPLSLCSVFLPQDQPQATNGSMQDGDLPKVEVNMDVLGRAACSPHPISSQCLPELRAGGWCVCKHAHAWENTGEPTTN